MRVVFFHKLFVNLFKLISLLGIIGIIIWLYISQPESDIKTDNKPAIGEIAGDISNNGFEVSIINSVFEGVTKDLKNYTIEADKTFKLTNDKYILDNIHATYPLDKAALLIKALEGFIDDSSKFMTISKQVQVMLDDWLLTADNLNINLKNEDISTESPSKIKYKNSEIVGDSFNTKNQTILQLKGNVLANIKLSDFKQNKIIDH